MKESSVKLWLFVGFLIIFVGVSIAYVLLGYQWPVGSDVTYYINPNTAQVTDEEDAVKSAADSWNGINPAGLTLSYGGSTSVTDFGLNGSNTICWKDRGNIGIRRCWVLQEGRRVETYKREANLS